MKTTELVNRLTRRRATLFRVSPDHHATALATTPPALRPLYATFNGGYFWGNALLIRPLTHVGGGPRTVAEWNEPSLWTGKYARICDELVCFAEDVFGDQFCARGDAIVRFDGETGDVRELAGSLDEGLELLLDNSDEQVGTPYLDRWEEGHSALTPGSRLVPICPFFLGGAFEEDNFIEEEDVAAMLLRATIWEQTQGLPEGSKVVLRVVP